jgi:hypothetical protein
MPPDERAIGSLTQSFGDKLRPMTCALTLHRNSRTIGFDRLFGSTTQVS